MTTREPELETLVRNADPASVPGWFPTKMPKHVLGHAAFARFTRGMTVDSWTPLNRLRAARLERLARGLLERGGTLLERSGGIPRRWKAHDTDEDGAATSLLPWYRTPEYLARHVVTRAIGFGFTLSVAPSGA